MSKFTKRIQKIVKITETALVVGQGFGFLSEILSIFDTVIVVSDKHPGIKSRNLVYRENFDYINTFTSVSAVFFDISQIDKLDILTNFWQRNKSYIIIEGDEPISREFSKPLYATGWGCTSKQGFFHVWEQLK